MANNPLLLTDPLGLYSCDDYGKNALAFTFGLIDGLTFGASSLILGMAVPGYNEFTENNGWFIGGMVVGSIAPALVTAGGSLAISAVSLGSRVLVRGATHAVVSGTEHLATSATRNTLMQTLEHAAGSGAREGLEGGVGGVVRDAALSGAPWPQNAVIGKVKDLVSIGPNEYTLLPKLPDLGSVRANWKQNSSVLRAEMQRAVPIRDASWRPGEDIMRQFRSSFLGAERNLLSNHGWRFDPSTSFWMPH